MRLIDADLITGFTNLEYDGKKIYNITDIPTVNINQLKKSSHGRMITIMGMVIKATSSGKEAREKFANYFNVSARYTYHYYKLALNYDKELINLIDTGTDIKLASSICDFEEDKAIAINAIKQIRSECKEKDIKCTQKLEKEAVHNALGKMDKIAPELDDIDFDELTRMMDDIMDPPMPDINLTGDDFDIMDTCI